MSTGPYKDSKLCVDLGDTRYTHVTLGTVALNRARAPNTHVLCQAPNTLPGVRAARPRHSGIPDCALGACSLERKRCPLADRALLAQAWQRCHVLGNALTEPH